MIILHTIQSLSCKYIVVCFQLFIVCSKYVNLCGTDILVCYIMLCYAGYVILCCVMLCWSGEGGGDISHFNDNRVIAKVHIYWE